MCREADFRTIVYYIRPDETQMYKNSNQEWAIVGILCMLVTTNYRRAITTTIDEKNELHVILCGK
jgi:hypothetical protein